MRSRRRTLVVTAACVALLAACGADEPTVEDPTADAGDAADTGDEADDADDGDGGGEPADATVSVGSTDLGEVLTDGEGMTLYLFDSDEAGQPTCYDDCAANWPPLEADGEPVAGDGADDELLGTVERDDGSTQVTYDGWPLYHFAADSEPGDTQGQGVNEVWWVLDGDGQPLRDADVSATENGTTGY